jgi:hypothetical protein
MIPQCLWTSWETSGIRLDPPTRKMPVRSVGLSPAARMVAAVSSAARSMAGVISRSRSARVTCASGKGGGMGTSV